MDSASRRRPHEVGEGAQNGIFCRVGYLLANAWQTSAGVGAWEQLSPHSLRHSAITFALDAGASLRDVQDYAATKIPARLAGTITPATAWTATRPMPSPPTWRDSIVGMRTQPPAPSRVGISTVVALYLSAGFSDHGVVTDFVEVVRQGQQEPA
jgi:hypothetical protein